MNLASSRIYSICCNKKPVKLKFIILPGLHLKGVACTMSKSISDGLINPLNVGSFWENDLNYLLFCSLKIDVEQFISSLQLPCVLVWLGLTFSEYLKLIYFSRWLIIRSDPDALLKASIPFRSSQLGWIVPVSSNVISSSSLASMSFKKSKFSNASLLITPSK